MQNMKNGTGILGLTILAVVAAGCLLSATFVVVGSFKFTTSEPSGVYHYLVDVTDEDVWKDHKDDIDRIDVVGFELWITNNESEKITFNVYVDDAEAPEYDNYTDVDANATNILDDLTLAAGPGGVTHVTYAQSFGYLKNVGELKELAKVGRFHCYGVSDGGTHSGFIVDSGKVVITFSASGT